ncbi:FtsX-like permease family protein [Kribbella sp. CA-247076]|uniref:FtsX-like permease family protein n=1 Tax=Kribbella sp. CA-247076 TaxID=3239941 RepID=UPI003D92BB27
MFLRRALRYRWTQAMVLTGVSLLIGTCAVFAPWFARAVEQTVMTEALSGQALTAAWRIESRAPARSRGPGQAESPEALDQLVPADLRPLFTPPVHGIYSNVGWRLPSTGDDPAPSGRLTWRDGYCDRLTVVEGRCPEKPNEVVASVADVDTWDLRIGTTLNALPSDNLEGGGTLTVVGLYRPKEPRATYWFGQYPTGHSRIPGAKDPGSSDYLFTDRTTFAQTDWAPRLTADTRPIPGVARIDDLERLQAASNTVNGNAAELGLFAENTSGLATLADRVQREREQATTIIPLVMVQVALFGVVVLALALAAVVDQRRPEIALARLRGSSARRTARALALELGLPVLVGSVAGGLTGFGLLLIVRATWLRNGSPIELPWTVPVALAVAVVVALVVVQLQVRGVVRQPISGLLRRVVPRRRRALGVVDLGIIVFAVAGLIAALSGAGRGPLPVLTPALLALGAGLAFAHLLLPTAGALSRQAARRGRLGLALGALQVSRRPAGTRIVAAVAVAAALLAFAGQAASVGEHNRETRAGYETGAEGVLRMNALYLGEFSKAVDQIDPDRRWLTPVVVASPPSPDALKSMMIEPDSFRRIAYRGDSLTDADGWAKLKAPTGPKPIEFRSARLTVTASTGRMKQVAAETANGEQPAMAPPRSVILRASVVSLRNGSRLLVSFPPMPLVPGKQFDLTAAVDCLGGCQLLQLGAGREPLDQAGVEGEVTISKIASADRPSIPLGPATDWSSVRQPGSDQGSITAKAGGSLTIAIRSLGNDQFLQYATVPPVVPALITPEYPYDDAATTSPAIDGSPMPLAKLDQLHGPVNRYPDRTAVVDLETVRRLAGSVDEAATDYELWLNADGLAIVDNLIVQLNQAGFAAELVDQRSDRIASYGRSASALALQLTPVVGIAGWALAIVVLLLTVVTSWRSRAQDYASLRITGVPATTTGRAARWEQTGPVALAVLLGTVCGVVGAQVALPLIPLFADPGGPVPLELDTNWTVALVLWLAGTAVLAVATLLLGTGVNRRAGYHRIREELT